MQSFPRNVEDEGGSRLSPPLCSSLKVSNRPVVVRQSSFPTAILTRIDFSLYTDEEIDVPGSAPSDAPETRNALKRVFCISNLFGSPSAVATS